MVKVGGNFRVMFKRTFRNAFFFYLPLIIIRLFRDTQSLHLSPVLPSASDAALQSSEGVEHYGRGGEAAGAKFVAGSADRESNRDPSEEPRDLPPDMLNESGCDKLKDLR